MYRILCDEGGVPSVSRLAPFVLLGLVAAGQLMSLWKTGQLAPIDETILGLFGLSGAQYLGAKALMRRRPAEESPPAAPS